MTRVLVFDSGLGGLSIRRALAEALPGVVLDYAADSAAFPYGRFSEAHLVARVRAVIAALLAAARAHAEAPDAVVIACNTASTAALTAVRADHPGLPFVGVVPAIKPAAALTASGVIGLLATPATAASPYTDRLIAEHAAGRTVLRHGAPRLAALAEAALRGQPPPPDALAAEIAPLFAHPGLDVVVLGCTHYPLLAAELAAAAPRPVRWLDSGAAVARQTARVLGGRTARTGGRPVAWLTAGTSAAEPALVSALAAEGLPPPRLLEVAPPCCANTPT